MLPIRSNRSTPDSIWNHFMGKSELVYQSRGSVLETHGGFPSFMCLTTWDRSHLPPVPPVPMRTEATEIEIAVAPLGKAKRREKK